MTLTPYRGGDETALVELWNRSASKDPITLDRFLRKVILDANFDPEGLLLARNGSGRPVGWVHAVVRRVPLESQLDPEEGWITALMVDPDHRRQGLGRALLERAEAYLRAKGRRRAWCAPYAPNYHHPGVEVATYPEGVALFAAAGYDVAATPVAMDRSLVDYGLPEDVAQVWRRLEAEGWRVEPITPARYHATLSLCARAFSADWTRALRDALSQGLDPRRLWIARRGEAVHGFALWGGYDGVAERFGPFGVEEAMRGLGLGKVLLYAVLQEMKAAGLHGAWFLWTGEERPAGHLYRRAGFRVTRRFHIYRKEL